MQWLVVPTPRRPLVAISDFVEIAGPSDGPGSLIVLGKESVDGGLEVDERTKDAALEATPGDRSAKR